MAEQLLWKWSESQRTEKVVSCGLFRCETERWKTEIVNKPKLRTYIPFKNTYEPERYMKSIRCKAHRSLLARLRGGTAQLEIETGRYVGIPPDQRFCKLCKDAVEDEAHFCTTCPVTHPTFPGNGGHSTRFQWPIRQRFIKIIQAANFNQRVVKSLFNLFISINQLLSE